MEIPGEEENMEEEGKGLVIRVPGDVGFRKVIHMKAVVLDVIGRVPWKLNMKLTNTYGKNLS